ncbi:Uncharacterised protein [Legionella beliardensis]|uniref:FUSC family protein n=1 Tax=Legionella beliardensis TaxID=91822 RepID=A0A378I4N9_9GAMM|nr:hypothetical protein [Legionella beliardensis]STX29802.1 Uncharacterised protein [Legionella beliardensis]
MKELIRFRNIPIFLWNIDPGYFLLKHAAKTVFAILITLSFLHQEPFFTKLIAGLVCGFSMQGIVAKTFSGRIIQVLIFDALYFNLFLLGLLIRDLSDIKGVVLILLGFAVNYIRRFNLQTSTAPMMMWMLCFLATILPVNTSHAITSHLSGLTVALMTSAVVLLFIFPENYAHLFVYNSNRLFQLLALGMLDIERYLLARSSIRRFEEKKFNQLKYNLNHLLDINQAIGQSAVLVKQQDKINEILTHQYALVHAYILMIEAYRILKIHGFHLSNTVRSALGSINKQFSELLNSIKMNKDHSIYGPPLIISMTHLADQLSQQRVIEPTIIMSILNLKLSFNIFNKHIDHLLVENNGC